MGFLQACLNFSATICFYAVAIFYSIINVPELMSLPDSRNGNCKEIEGGVLCHVYD